MATIRQRLAEESRSRFVGRADLLDDFDEFLAAPGPIFQYLTGVGGIGKSTLLREYHRRLDSRQLLFAHIDLDTVISPLEILNVLSQRFHALGIEIRSYRRADKRLQVVQAGANRYLAAGSQGAVSAIRDGVPLGMGHLLMGVAGGEDRVREWIQDHFSSDDAWTYLHAQDVLAKALATDLAQRPSAQTSRFVLTFDTLEKAPRETQDWLRSELFENLDENVRLVVAGQNSLNTGWVEWSAHIHIVDVPVFSRAEVHEYLLATTGSASEAVAGDLRLASGGLPLAVALGSESIRADPELGPGLSANSTAEMVSHVIGRLLKRQDRDSGIITLIWAVAGIAPIRRDLMESILARPVTDTQWTELEELPFVRVVSGGYAVHDIVQDFLIRNRINTELVDFRVRQRIAADYWAATGDVDAELRSLALSDPDHAMARIETHLATAFARSDGTGAERIVSVLADASRYHPDAAAMSKLAESRVLCWRGDWGSAASVLADTNLTSSVSPQLSAAVKRISAEVLRYLGRLSEAMVEVDAGLSYADLESDHPSALMPLLTGKLELCGLLGMPEDAGDVLRLIHTVTSRVAPGPSLERSNALFYEEHLYRWLGDWTRATAALERVQASDLTGGDDSPTLARFEYGLGRLFTFVGRLTEAERLLRSASVRFERQGREQHLAETRVGLAIVTFETGRLDEADELLVQASALFAQSNSQLYEAWVYVNKMRFRWLSGARPPSRDRVLRLRNGCRKMGYRLGEGLAQQMYESLYDQASPKAASMFRSWGMRYEELQVRLSAQPGNAELAHLAAACGDVLLAATAVGRRTQFLQAEASLFSVASWSERRSALETLLSLPVPEALGSFLGPTDLRNPLAGVDDLA